MYKSKNPTQGLQPQCRAVKTDHQSAKISNSTSTISVGEYQHTNLAKDVSDVAAQLNRDAVAILEHFHGPHNRRLSNKREMRWYEDGKLRLKLDGSGKWTNFATGEYGDVLDAIGICIGADLSASVKWARENWLHSTERLSGSPRLIAKSSKAQVDAKADAAQRTRFALSIWEASKPTTDTLAETYLASRYIAVCDELRASDSLRFHPGLKHPDGQILPCMVALFRNILTGNPCGIHRTFIPDAKKFGAPLMLGQSRGGAIMLSPNEEVEQGLGIAEGIETSLSWYSRDRRPVWAVGSAGGIDKFPILNGLESLTVYADNDESGRGEEAATSCCQRYSEAGIEATYRMPLTVATDWNDWRAA